MEFLNKKFTKNPAVISKKIDNETILVPLKSQVSDMDNLFTLNPVGAFIWDNIDGETSVLQIIQKIKLNFDTAGADVKKETINLMKELEKNQLVVP